MNLTRKMLGATALAIVAAGFAMPASATPVMCESLARNHMYVDSSYVASCVDAGTGNINGNASTDRFLIANPSLHYTGIGSGSYTQASNTINTNSGAFWFNSSLWNTWSSIAIGFKFGTGNSADNWFVYILDPRVSSGTWSFINVFHRGGGLSHIQLYGVERRAVPEPGTLALLGGATLLGAAFGRRRKKATN